MRRLFVALLSVGMMPSFAGSQQPQHTVSDLVKSSVDSVVLIVTSDENGRPLTEGSGFIVSADGKIATNNHVIKNAHSAIVKLNNGAFFAVEGVVAEDSDHDIAILKVAGKNLPTLTLADSDLVSVGDHVVAIGSPLGLQNSVSDGIISAIREDAKGRQWIQTTAAASHGNSGGPLLTMQGEAVGLLTLKLSEGENLNFAVPSKVLGPMLSSTEILPLGAKQRPAGSEAAPIPTDAIWTSLTTGRDYRMRIDGDYIYTEWVNLPASLQGTVAFSRSELKRDGDKWKGVTRTQTPCYQAQTIVKWCTFEFDLEIDKISVTRIEGGGTAAKSVDCRKCEQRDKYWRPFTWIPK